MPAAPPTNRLIASQTSDGMQQQYREVDQVATAFQENERHGVRTGRRQAAEAAVRPIRPAVKA